MCLALVLRRWGRYNIRMQRIFITLVVSLLVPTGILFADPVSAEQAETVVDGWLAGDTRPLGADMDRAIAEIQTFSNDSGTILYYVICLQGEGFVVVSGDDLIEPIIAFSPQGSYDPSPVNPLGALVGCDLAGRAAVVRNVSGKPVPGDVEEAMQKAAAKWEALAGGGMSFKAGDGDIDGERVPPLVESKWGQITVDGTACYNYYTPPNVAGTVANYPCGCAATAMAQVMRFHEHPTAGVGTPAFDVTVDDVVEQRTLRGGNGSGGAYSWDDMILVPDATITVTQREAIGALCYDAGVAAGTSYTAALSTVTGSVGADVLVSTFNYSNSIEGFNGGADIGAGLDDMINPNLDSGRPVILGLGGDAIGHAVVCDGYGYDGATLYHHLNLGWDGLGDAWYDLPTTDTGIVDAEFTTVDGCVYNVYKAGSGEIIAGRVTDSAGIPVSGVTVTATKGVDTYEATTNARGIYAVEKLPSASTYTVSAAKTWYYFADQSVSTETSITGAVACGNEWGADFVNNPSIVLPIPKVEKFQAGPGDGYIDVEWVYPTPLDSYDGVMVTYGLSVFPSLEVVDDGEGGEELQLNDGTQLYAGKEDTSAKLDLDNGTTAFFAVWAYRTTEYKEAKYASATSAEGADGITDAESFYGPSGGGGGGGGCFISTAFAGEDDTGSDKKKTREANRKRIRQSRIKFLELYRKAKKPKKGPGRIVGFVVDRRDYCAIEGSTVKATLVPEKKDGEPKSEPKSRQALSRKEGVYEIESLKPGRYTVEAAAEGYDPYKKDNVFVKPGIGPGLGRWLVIEMKKRVAQKGGLLGELKFIEPTFKHIKVLVTKAADGWDDIKDKEIILFSGTNESVVKSMKSLTVGDTVECHFVRRGGRYNLIDVAKEEGE